MNARKSLILAGGAIAGSSLIFDGTVLLRLQDGVTREEKQVAESRGELDELIARGASAIERAKLLELEVGQLIWRFPKESPPQPYPILLGQDLADQVLALGTALEHFQPIAGMQSAPFKDLNVALESGHLPEALEKLPTALGVMFSSFDKQRKAYEEALKEHSDLLAAQRRSLSRLTLLSTCLKVVGLFLALAKDLLNGKERRGALSD